MIFQFIKKFLNFFILKVSKNQLEKLTINTRYHPPTPVSLSNNNNGCNNGSNNNYNSNINGSNCQIGSNTNAVTVVKVNLRHLSNQPYYINYIKENIH